MAYRVLAAGLGVAELPIIFYERASGSSRMSKKIIREAVVLPWRLRLARLFRSGGRGMEADPDYNIRTVAGFLALFSGIAGSAWLGWCLFPHVRV
jgi:hypothetical protein